MNSNPFKPAWWLPSGHLQTIWPVLCRRRKKRLAVQYERVELPDGDFVDLVWVAATRSQHGMPLILILHGFEGSIRSHYATTMLSLFSQQGWRGVFMHFRGCSGEPNRLARCYHSGETSDLAHVTQILCEREPDTSFAAIGFSLGGNVLLKWLGETGTQNPLQAAIAVSAPFELGKTSLQMQHGFAKVYQWYFLKCLRERLLCKFQCVPTPIDLQVLSRLRTLYEFDNKVTAPLHGFVDAEDYYHVSSSRQYLSSIRVPTLLVHAKDDPLMTQDVIPQPHELSEYVKLEVTEAGGHVGFVAGRFPWRPKYWLEQRVPAFFQEHLSVRR
jgi:predicted alpha/beta-fold hydrolase